MVPNRLFGDVVLGQTPEMGSPRLNLPFSTQLSGDFLPLFYGPHHGVPGGECPGDGLEKIAAQDLLVFGRPHERDFRDHDLHQPLEDPDHLRRIRSFDLRVLEVAGSVGRKI